MAGEKELTYQEAQDFVEKHRAVLPKWRRRSHWRSKLTYDDVRRIADSQRPANIDPSPKTDMQIARSCLLSAAKRMDDGNKGVANKLEAMAATLDHIVNFMGHENG